MKYFSNKIILKQNLIDDYLYLKQKKKKNICAVVKANAYGHNAKAVVKILGKYCNFFVTLISRRLLLIICINFIFNFSCI